MHHVVNETKTLERWVYSLVLICAQMNGKVIALLAVGLALIAWLMLNQSNPSVSAPPHSPSASPEPKTRLRLPAPRITATPTPIDSSEELRSTNLYTRLVNGDVPKLSPEQLDTYLMQNQRNAESLLIASRVANDTALLKEAQEKFPNDPRVAYASLFKCDTPEERSQWLERLKQSAPDNALPSYLSALDSFKSGQMDRAVEEITAASSKQQFQDYSMDFLQNGEDAYRSAGYSEADAKSIAATQLLLPQLSELRELGRQMAGLANSYRQAGDTASADAALQMDIALSQRFGGYPGEPLINQLVGIAIERHALTTMDPNSPYDTSGQTAQDRINQLDKSRQALKGLAQQEVGLFQKMSDPDVVSYWDRWRTFGYEPAMRWAIGKYGGQSANQ
jgi:hypothetical protein